jgi:transposase-like protein
MFFIARVRIRIDGLARESTRAASIPQFLPTDSTYAEFVICYQSIEQDHRFIKKRITASLGFRSVEGACRTIEGYEAMHAIRKGQVRWVAKGDAVAQRQFIHSIFGIAA